MILALKLRLVRVGSLLSDPNNPTGAVYSKELLMEIVEIARQHNLIIFADEIYDKILYDDAEHHSIAPLAPDLLTITFNGLSKTYRVAGFRGWMVLNGPKKHAKGYIEGLEMLASMRLCANVPAQHAIQTALGGYQSISEFITPGGRLYEQRNRASGTDKKRDSGRFLRETSWCAVYVPENRRQTL